MAERYVWYTFYHNGEPLPRFVGDALELTADTQIVQFRKQAFDDNKTIPELSRIAPGNLTVWSNVETFKSGVPLILDSKIGEHGELGLTSNNPVIISFRTDGKIILYDYLLNWYYVSLTIIPSPQHY
jgi:hypothetical protein